jgi:hypothetical protein
VTSLARPVVAWLDASAKRACVGLAATAFGLSAGCASLLGGAAGDTLESAILDQEDPALVRAGVPAYLLLVDGLIHRNPDNAGLLAAGAELFALYGARFEADPLRAVALTAKARRYGHEAICAAHAPACEWPSLDYDAFVAALAESRRRHVEVLYAYAVSWLSYLDATSDEWGAVADLPRVEAVFGRLLELDESHDRGGVHTYLGILNSLRPPALGGRPEVARMHFERAIELSEGRDLSAKVEYARRYARLVFDQELHDRLLTEVESAPVEAPGLTLFNVLAKEEARTLLETSREYF